MVEKNEDKSLGFKWLKKKGVGGKDKKIQFYESFVYDEVEYTLYDCVYMYKEGYPEPYIGKLIKIWEHAGKTKKVKVQWFFYSWEILNYLGGKKVQDREIFLASGEGFGVANVNPLDKSRWFRELPWEERLQKAYEQGVLVLLQNLDPDYTSEEVEGIIWHAFNESCTAKIVQHTAISSPFSGQALIIFKTRDATERVMKKLGTGCLMLSNGRPLVGSRGPLPNISGRQSTFSGHLVIDKIKIQMQREMKDAVSTSHCSQPNTIEYEMAMDWCALQTRSEIWWSKLYKEQRKQLQILEKNLKKN